MLVSACFSVYHLSVLSSVSSLRPLFSFTQLQNDTSHIPSSFSELLSILVFSSATQPSAPPKQSSGRVASHFTSVESCGQSSTTQSTLSKIVLSTRSSTFAPPQLRWSTPLTEFFLFWQHHQWLVLLWAGQQLA